MRPKVKTLKLFFVFDDEDWVMLSDALQKHFPQAVYFSRNLKTRGYLSQPGDHNPLYWRSLEQFQKESPGDVYTIRDPWPEDIASAVDLDLIGGWESAQFHATEEVFHRHGRCAEFTRSQRNSTQQTIATCTDRFGELAVERIGTWPASAYGDAQFIFYEQFSTLRISINEHELPLKEFGSEVLRIVQQLGTRSVALFNPLTRELLDPSYATSKVLIGWNLLRKIYDEKTGYLMMPAVYDDVSDFHPKRDGVAGLIGPRPSHPKVREWREKK